MLRICYHNDNNKKGMSYGVRPEFQPLLLFQHTHLNVILLGLRFLTCTMGMFSTLRLKETMELKCLAKALG